jgi:hypothetical protein
VLRGSVKLMAISSAGPSLPMFRHDAGYRLQR